MRWVLLTGEHWRSSLGRWKSTILRLGAFYRAVKSETSRTGIDPRVTPLFPHDARKLPGLRNHSVDAAVTSPPYVSAQEYFRTVKLELFWLGLADERGVIELDKQVLGTEKVSKGSNPEFRELGVPSLDPGLVQIYRIDRARWLVAFEYFDGLRSHFSRMAQVLRPGCRVRFPHWRQHHPKNTALQFTLASNRLQRRQV